MLACELDPRFGDGDAERAHDVALQFGGVQVEVELAPTGRIISAVFPSVVDAALAALETAAAMPRAAAAGMRIAVCTTETVGGGLPSRAAALAYATRLLAQAEPGRMLLTAPAAVLAGPALPPGVELLDQGLRTLEPGGRPERVYVMARAGAGSPDEVAVSNLGWARRAAAAAGGETYQMDSVRKVWQHTQDGSAGMVLVSGSSAAVRSAFVAELALRVHAEGALVMNGQWAERARAPYGAFREALGFYAAGSSTRQLVADLEGRADDVALLLPEVGARVGGSHLARSGGHAERARVFDAVGAWVLAIAKRSPTAMILEDLHWAESTSVLLLAHLWHTCRRHRLMLVVTGESAPGNAIDRLADLAAYIDADALERVRLP
ncbi:ATP-binding protein [Nonomuraea sp. B12E4]|uniref:ATP-binding protein n=1 Tax=Nonomuraea sp. B12E4 TaxID=3153564 RepID=UPI00325DD433